MSLSRPHAYVSVRPQLLPTLFAPGTRHLPAIDGAPTAGPLPSHHPFMLAASPLLHSMQLASFSGAGVGHRMMSAACLQLVLLYGRHAVQGLEGQHTVVCV